MDDQLSFELRTGKGEHSMRTYLSYGLELPPEPVSVSLFAKAIAARNLKIIRLLEKTLGSFEGGARHIEAVGSEFKQLLQELQTGDHSEPIDPNGSTSEILERTAEDARTLYASAEEAQWVAISNPAMKDEDLIAVCQTLMDAIRSMYDACEELRHWVGDHDAALEPGTGVVYTNAADMIAALRAG